MRRRAYDDGEVVFDPLSWETHFVDDTAGLLLESIQQLFDAGATSDEQLVNGLLAEAYGAELPSDPEELALSAARLRKLVAIARFLRAPAGRA